MILNNPTSSTVYFPIYQPDSEPNSTGAYIPAGATVDLAADGNASEEAIFNSIPLIRSAIEDDKLFIVSVGTILSKQDSLDNLAIRFKSFLRPTQTIEWTENGRLTDNSFLHNGVLAGGEHNGFIFDEVYEVVSAAWEQDHSEQSGGHFVFKNNSDQETIGSIAIASDGHGVEHSGTDFTAFTLPKNKRVGIQWQGSTITDVTLIVTLREV